MTNRARSRLVLDLERRVVVAKLNALAWLKEARRLRIHQIELIDDGLVRTAALAKLSGQLKFIEEHEGLLSMLDDATSEPT